MEDRPRLAHELVVRVVEGVDLCGEGGTGDDVHRERPVHPGQNTIHLSVRRAIIHPL